MKTDSKLAKLIRASFAYQRLMFYGMGIVSALTGIAILVLSITMPPEPGEEKIVLVLQIVALVFILFAFWSAWYVRRREAQVLRLLFEHPEQIESVKSVALQRRGVTGRAIRIHTKQNKMVGFNVNGQRNQEELLALLKQHLKDTGVSA